MNKPFLKIASKTGLLFGLTLATGLGGCMTEEVRDKITQREPTIISGAARAEAPADKVNYNPLVVTDKVWTGDRSVRMRRGLPLPATYEGASSMSLVSSKSMTLPELAMFISQQTGVPVRLVDGAEKVSGGPNGGSGAAPSAAGAAGGSTAGAASGAAMGGEMPEADKGNSDNGGMKVAYQGPLSAFLDSLSSYFGVSWRYDGSAIIVSRFETRTFTIEAMGSTAEFTDGISGSGGGSSGGGSASGGASASQQTGSLDQTTKFGGKVDYWAELQDSVNTILSGVGTVKTSPSSGTVTVITTPEIMRTVAQYVDQENARSTKQVAITVELFTLTLDNSENVNTQLNFLYSGGSFDGNNSAVPLAPIADAGGSFGVSIVNPNSKFKGSSALIQALSKIGNVSRVAKIPLTTLNNRPATRRIGRDIAYLAQSQITEGSTLGSLPTVTQTPGNIAEGFSLQVTPRILGDSRILVQFSLSVLDLIEIKSFGSTTSQIQLPTTSSRVFVQQAMLNNGDTLVLAGFDQGRQESTNSGFLNPFNILLGGTISSSDTREMLFLTLTPREIDVPRRMPTSGGL